MNSISVAFEPEKDQTYIKIYGVSFDNKEVLLKTIEINTKEYDNLLGLIVEIE